MSSEFELLQRALAGRYSLVREIGRGGMGVVFLAREAALDRLVAIKLLPPAMARDPAERERFLREARTAARLAHPHIVPIHTVEADGDVVWFAMEYIAGESLGELLREGALPADAVFRLAQEAGWALSHAHALGVIHRDVKPDNILVEAATGRTLVTDFGIAHHPELSDPRIGHGTLHYMSPEQAMGSEVDARADIYSLGVTLFHALTGRRPFEGLSGAALLTQQGSEHPPTVASLSPRAPTALATVIDRAILPDPDARWPSMEEFTKGLAAARALVPSLPVPLQRFGRHAVEHGRQLGPMAGVAAAALLGALFTNAFLDNFLGIEVAIYLLLAAISGVVAIGMVVEQVREIRALARLGYRRAAALRAIESVDVEEARVAAPVAGPAWSRRPRAIIPLGVALTVAGLMLVSSASAGIPVLIGFALSLFTPAITVSRIARIKGMQGSWWGRLLGSRVGGWLWQSATLGQGPVAEAVLGGEPTALALGGIVQSLFGELSPSEQQLLHEVPELAARLEARAMDSAAPDRTEALVALESLRLDLLRLRAGQVAATGITEDLRKLRDVGFYVDARSEI
ncbi:MAG TPA: serine/threonine-protein kinase [Gemmatimonadales bacterium]|nr:serine/threonine-protein kinase [Gemmatimonadales bacterium]